MSSFPDIPDLDNVEVNCEIEERTWAIGLLVAGIGLAMAGYFVARADDGPGRMAGAVITGIPGLAAIIGAVILSLRYNRWLVDRDGVTARGWFGRSRFIPWHEVRDVVVERGGYTRIPLSLVQPQRRSPAGVAVLPEDTPDMPIDGRAILEFKAWKEIAEVSQGYFKCLRLITANGGLRLPNNSEMDASVLQHMKLLDAHADSPFLKHVHAFWAPVPENTPREMEWFHPKPPTLALPIFSAIAFTLVSIGLIINLRSGSPQHRFPWECVGFLTYGPMIAVGFIGRRRLCARRVEVTESGILIRTLRGEITVPWSDCKFHGWNASNDLLLSYSEAATPFALIPNVKQYPESRDLQCAIVKRLREQGQAVPLPDSLRVDPEE